MIDGSCHVKFKILFQINFSVGKPEDNKRDYVTDETFQTFHVFFLFLLDENIFFLSSTRVKRFKNMILAFEYSLVFFSMRKLNLNCFAAILSSFTRRFASFNDLIDDSIQRNEIKSISRFTAYTNGNRKVSIVDRRVKKSIELSLNWKETRVAK